MPPTERGHRMKSGGCNDKSKQTAFKQEAQFKEFFPENVFIKEAI